MPRPPRRGSESGIHHVMNRGVDHQPIFLDDADRLEMGRRLAAIHDELGVVTLAYCLMGNHLHLVLHAPDGVLPEAMHHLTSVYSHEFNARHHRDGPVFRGRYHSIPVETDSYLLWVVRYVHRNPLDIRGVRSPRDFRWSSFRAYLGLRPCPTFLDLRPVLDLLGGRVDELAAMTEEGARVDLVVGSDLLNLVYCARAVEDVETTIDRTVLVLIGERTDDPTVARLVESALGPRDPVDARRATRRALARLRDDEVLRSVSWIERQLAGAGS